MTSKTRRNRAARTAAPAQENAEEAYWRAHFRSRPYVEESAEFDRYRPAYKYGGDARRKHHGKSWRDVEAELAAGWATARDDSDLDWRTAKNACRDAWDYVDRFMRE